MRNTCCPPSVPRTTSTVVSTPKPNQTPAIRRVPSRTPGPSTVTSARSSWLEPTYFAVPFTAHVRGESSLLQLHDRPGRLEGHPVPATAQTPPAVGEDGTEGPPERVGHRGGRDGGHLTVGRSRLVAGIADGRLDRVGGHHGEPPEGREGERLRERLPAAGCPGLRSRMKRTMIGLVQLKAAKNTWWFALRISTYRLFGHSSLSASESAGGMLRSRSPVMMSAGTFGRERRSRGDGLRRRRTRARPHHADVGRERRRWPRDPAGLGEHPELVVRQVGQGLLPLLHPRRHGCVGVPREAVRVVHAETRRVVALGEDPRRVGFAALWCGGLGRQSQQRRGVAGAQGVAAAATSLSAVCPKSPDWRMLQASGSR